MPPQAYDWTKFRIVIFQNSKLDIRQLAATREPRALTRQPSVLIAHQQLAADFMHEMDPHDPKKWKPILASVRPALWLHGLAPRWQIDLAAIF